MYSVEKFFCHINTAEIIFFKNSLNVHLRPISEFCVAVLLLLLLVLVLLLFCEIKMTMA